MTAWDARFEEVLRTHLPYLEDDGALEAGSVLVDLGLDSMASISLLLDLEVAYDTEFGDDAMVPETFDTVGSLWLALAAARAAMTATST